MSYKKNLSRYVNIIILILVIINLNGCDSTQEASGIAYGKGNGKIEVVNYTSFQCGGCMELHEELGESIKKYIDSGDIKYIEKQIDIKRFKYDDLIYKHMNEEQISDFDKLSEIYEKQNEWIVLESPEEVIDFLELNPEENKKHIKDIEKINKEKMELELKEVPAMFINGEEVPANISKEEFENKIEDILNKE